MKGLEGSGGIWKDPDGFRGVQMGPGVRMGPEETIGFHKGPKGSRGLQ